MINNISRYEFKKVYLNIRVWTILLLCFVWNAYLYLNSDQKFYSKYYMEVKNDIINDKAQFTFQSEDNDDKEYTYNIVLKEYISVMSVHAYIDYVHDSSDKNVSVFVFNDKKNDFSIRNITKTKHDYAKLNDISVSFGGTFGLSKALDFLVTDICMIILIIVCIYYIFMDEQKSEMIYVSNSTKGGRIIKCISQWCSVVIVTTGLVFLFYCGNIIMSVLYTGPVNMNLPIQALWGYDKSSFDITIGEYIMQFFLVKTFNCVLVASFIFFLAVLMKNDLFFYFGIGTFFIFNMLMNNVQNLWGLNEYLKYCNLIYIFRTTGFYKNYYNLDFFDWPVSHYALDIVMGNVISLLLISCSCIIYTRKNVFQLSKKINNKSVNKSRKEVYYSKLFWYEIKKGLVGNKLLLLITIIGTTSFLWYANIEKNLKSKEFYYLYYVNESYGMSTEELDCMNIMEKEKIDEYKQRIIVAEKEYQSGEIAEDKYAMLCDYYTQLLQCEGGFREWQKQYEYIVSYNNENNEHLDMINILGWRKAFGADKESKYNYRVMYVFILIFLLPMLSIVFLCEKSTEMYNLNNSTKKGKAELTHAKYKFCMMISFIISLIVFVAYICFVDKIYGLSDGFSAAASIPWLEQFGDINIIVLFVGTILLRILAIQFVTTIIILSIQKTNNFIASITRGGAVILLFSIILL